MKEYPTQNFYYEFIRHFWFLEVEFHLAKALYEPPFGPLEGGVTSHTEWNLSGHGCYFSKQSWVAGLGLDVFLRLTWKKE